VSEQTAGPALEGQPVFYYDLGSPGCYLLGERVMGELPIVPEWEPVHAASLGLEPPPPDADELGRQIAQAGLQPLRLPDRWPPATERAMLAATFAKHIGRAVAFSLAAFRQAFAGGRDLGDDGTVLIAAAACEMHPTAVLKGMGLRSVTDGLRGAHERARAAGVTALPAIQVGDETFCGDDALARAGEALGLAR
jgi:2-hydroxychromene-2-carboxylate isomerase